jgi:hypothetical protein
MKRAFVFVALLAAGLAMADDVARMGNDTIRLRRTECPTEVLAQIPESLRDTEAFQASNFQAADATVQGKTFRGCWMMRQDGRVFLIYEDGDVGLIRRSEFSPGI